jgi:hypothetical protein
MTSSRRRYLPLLLALPLLAACETPGSSSEAPAPSRVSGPSTPAPLPSGSGAADDYEAARRASRGAAPTGPNAMPGFFPVDRVSTDVQLAPVPQPLPR